MPSETVDIFIPVSPGKLKKFPAALCSALTQTYSSIRPVLFLDCVHGPLESILEKWWYTPHDFPRPAKSEFLYTRTGRALTLQYCERGVVVRNPSGPSGSAGIARQWLFEWEGKSPWVKMLDSDDILTPETIEKMMAYAEPGVDGVFCPLVRCSGYRFAEIISGQPKKGSFGSGSMLLRKEFMQEALKRGFVWPAKHGHDGSFMDFIGCNKFNFRTTAENVLYLYLK